MLSSWFKLKKNIKKAGLHSQKGFSLIELLTVIAVIAILSSIIFINYRNYGKKFALERSAYKLAQDIRRAGEMAMSAQECARGALCVPPFSVPSRYGVYIHAPSENLYVIFADVDDNGVLKYPSPNECTEDVKIETIYYEKDVIAKEQGVTGSGCSGSLPPSGQRRLHITFKPPSPDIEIKIGRTFENSVSCSEATLELTVFGNPELTKSVKINKAGMIEIQ